MIKSLNGDPHGSHSKDQKKTKPHKKLLSICKPEDPLVGTVAQKMQGRRRGRSTLYIIGDYLYTNGVLQNNKLKMRCRDLKNCISYAYLEPDTLKVIKFTREHTCIKDPYLKFQIHMENEMKEMAETCAQGSKDSFKEIYDIVCKKNQEVSSRISFSRMYKVMDGIWRQAKSTRVDSKCVYVTESGKIN